MLALFSVLSASSAFSQTRVDFQTQIKPILEKHCLECHSQDKRKGGLSLATYEDALEGGRNGAVIRPGNGARSLLIHRIRGDIEPQMPKDEDPLSAAEIALLRAWIDQGARLTPTSARAPQPWEAPLTLTRPAVPAIVWPEWSSPLDRQVAAYLARRAPLPPAQRPRRTPPVISDQLFARRAYLDIWGLLPTPEQLQAFVDDKTPSKRDALVRSLLADNDKYAAHWMSFWNDLLRNEEGVTYFSENAGRKSITEWLYTSLATNRPYDEFVRNLLNPAAPGDPEGFLIGVNWRGETSAAVTPWMQASQNTAQVFLGINLKCNSCHDSFINRWKLNDAYALAAYFAPEPKLQLYRCDVAMNKYAEPAFLFPQVSHAPASPALHDRRAAAAATFTDPRMGRLPRTLVNRVWQRLMGRGIVANPDEMDGLPWSPQVLDWLASDFVAHEYDIKHLIATIVTSRTYQMPAVARTGEPSARKYVFEGPEVRRLTAEQFADAVGAITGEWNTYPGKPVPAAPRGRGVPPPSLPPTSGVYGREWLVASNSLSRALGRPIRDQVTSVRAVQATTPQALELVNGEWLTRWLSRGARRMLGELPPDTLSIYNRTVAGRNATSSAFDIDVSKSKKLWLIVQEAGSNVPEVVQPAWAQAEFTGPAGVTPLSELEPLDASGLRDATGPLRVPSASGTGVRVKNPSVLVYDISGKGFTNFRGVIGIENRQSDIGSTLNPQVRFFVFDSEPDMDRLLPPASGAPLPAAPSLRTSGDVVDRVFRHALGRAPSQTERTAALQALKDPAGSPKPYAAGLADLLWAVLMKPEFQLVY